MNAEDSNHIDLFTDGFIVQIQRPDSAGNVYLCERHSKSCDSLNVQYITDKDGRVRHIITGLAGTHSKSFAEDICSAATRGRWTVPKYRLLGK